MPEQSTKDLVEAAAKATEAVRGRVDEAIKRIDDQDKIFEKLDGIDKDMVMKASTEAGEAVQGLRDLQAEVKTGDLKKELESQAVAAGMLKERLDAVESHVAKSPYNVLSGKNQPVQVSDYYKQLGKSMRRPAAMKAGQVFMTEEASKAEATKMVETWSPHLDEEAKSEVIKTLTAGFATEGGYWVPTERAARMVTRMFETNPMRQLSSIMSTGTDMVDFVIDDNELTAIWGGELHTITDTDTPKIGLLQIPVHELYARPLITLKMLEDAQIDIVGWLSDKATDRFGRTESTAFVAGDGSQKPRGFLNYQNFSGPGVYTRDAIERVNSGADGGFGAQGEGLFRVQNSMKEVYQQGAAWLCKRATFLPIMTLRDNDGQYLFRFGDAIAAGVGMMILGKPLFFADDMPDVATDSLSVAYGNFQAGYQIVDRLGISVLVDPFSVDPKIRYRYRKRVGGGVVNFEAIKLLSLSA